MEKELKEFEEGPKAKIHLDSLRATLRKYKIGKLQAMMQSKDSCLESSLPSMTD